LGGSAEDGVFAATTTGVHPFEDKTGCVVKLKDRSGVELGSQLMSRVG
jgi:hypothetical protein